jgi:hypothetical protein
MDGKFAPVQQFEDTVFSINEGNNVRNDTTSDGVLAFPVEETDFNTDICHPTFTTVHPSCCHIQDDRHQCHERTKQYRCSSSDGESNNNLVPITRATMIYVLCAALNSCNLGYDIGVSTNVSKLLQNDMHITDAQREIWIGLINFGASTLI